MDISTIYAAGISIVTTSPVYDPTQPQKTWMRPLQTGDDPTDDFEYEYAEVDNSKPAPYVSWHTGVVSKGTAAASNIAPPGYIPPSGVTPVTGAVPIPMDETFIPTGYALTGTPFGLALEQSAPPVTATASEEDRILAGVNALLVKAGLPTV